MALFTIIRTICSIHNDYVWPSQWVFVTSQWFICLQNEAVHLHNDFLWFLSYHTFIIKFDCDFDNDSIWLQNDSVWPHHDTVWPHNEFTFQWLCLTFTVAVLLSLYLYMILTMTLCDLPNDCVSSQGLRVSSQWLCALHNNYMTSTMILCELNNDSLWSKQWFCVPSQRGCVVFMRVLVTFTMTYVPSQWLMCPHCDLCVTVHDLWHLDKFLKQVKYNYNHKNHSDFICN